MTSTERVMAALRHGRPDRAPVYESFWPQFVEKWRAEKGLGPDVDINEYYQLDLPSYGKVIGEQGPWPSRACDLERGPGYRIRRTAWGAVVKTLDTMSTDELIEPAIQDRGGLAALPPFEPADSPGRYSAVADWVRQVVAKGFCCFAKTGGPFSRTWPYRGLDAFLIDLIEDEPFAAELLTRQTDLLIATTRRMLRVGGLPRTVVWIADDCAYRNAPLFSPRTYERLIQPQLARLCEAIHATGRLAAFESEGNVGPLLDLILDAGVDVLCNMEPRAGMDVVELHRRFGARAAFIGTMCNTVLLPRGSPQAIRAETLRTLRAAADGGFVFGSAHTIGADVPVANYEAFRDTLREHGDLVVSITWSATSLFNNSYTSLVVVCPIRVFSAPRNCGPRVSNCSWRMQSTDGLSMPRISFSAEPTRLAQTAGKSADRAEFVSPRSSRGLNLPNGPLA